MTTGAASDMARRLYAVDAHYRQLVESLGGILLGGRFHRAALMEAVLLADEWADRERFKELLRDPVPMSEGQRGPK